MAGEPRGVLATPFFPNFNVSLVYFNGFNAGASNTEVSALLTQDNQPAVKIVMPFPIAKAFAEVLTDLVSQYESATETTILDMEELSRRLSKVAEKNA